MSETKADKLAGTKISRRAHTWCTKEQADFIAAKLSSLALMEAELRVKAIELAGTKASSISRQSDLMLKNATLKAERDKLLAVNKVLERSHKLMLALVLDDESKATKEQLAESVDIYKALKLAGESV
jgi:hypothetical protein